MKRFLLKTAALSAAVILVFISGIIADAATAKVPREVKVGYSLDDYEYFHIDSDGTKSGYGYEYMQELAKFAGWKCEYIAVSSWSETLDMLRSGEVDIVSPMKYSAERDKDFYYPSISMGKSFTTLEVLSDNKKYIDMEISDMNGIRVGLMVDDRNSDLFTRYAKMNSLSYTAINYSDETKRMDALNSGVIDAIVNNSVDRLDGLIIITKFGMEQFYCVVSDNNIVMQNELTEGISAMEIRNPNFTQDLYRKYYGAKGKEQLVLTGKEREYLKNCGVIRAAITPGAYPISYTKNGEFMGIVADVMNKISEELKIKFEFLESESYDMAMEMVLTGEADILCDFGGNYNLADKEGLKFTTPYIENMYSIIRGKHFNDNPAKTIGLVNGFYVNNTIEPQYDPANIKYYDTEEKCVRAVLDGRVDSGCISTYVAEDIMQRYYRQLDSYIYKSYRSNLCVAMAIDANPMLFNVIDKQINTISNDEINAIVKTNIAKRVNEPSILDVIYQNPISAIWLVIIISVAIICLTLYIMRSRREHSEHIFRLAYMDDLSGLWNSHYLEERIPGILHKSPNRPFILISMDISKFTAINEGHGRNFGNKVIKFTGDIIRRYSADGVAAARVKADHFLILTSYSSLDNLNDILKNMREELSVYSDRDVSVRLVYNIGVYPIKNINMPATSMIDMAELARRECKAGAVKLVFFDSVMEKRLHRENDIEDSMAGALKDGEFQVYYQPKTNIFTGEMCGAEALVRWDSPEKGFMNPADFIPIFEKNGFVNELDYFVLEQVFILQKTLIDMGRTIVPISVNQSRMNFSDEHYRDRLLSVTEKYKLPAGAIELEITETAFANPTVLSEFCQAIKDMGFRLSVDDYGAEYSSPMMLKESCLDVLKIDRSFLNETQLSSRCKTIVSKIVEMAHELGMEVVCEGVELETQVEFLKSINCKIAQGYYYARPMPESNFLRKLYESAVIL